jgi:hypothetical protein
LPFDDLPFNVRPLEEIAFFDVLALLGLVLVAIQTLIV